MPKPAADAPEHVKARYWRDEIMGLSRENLAPLIGFSTSTITDMETGYNRSTKRPIDPDALQRYRMACAAVTLGLQFDWLSCAMTPTTQIKITVGIDE